jgi:FtsH-binding integral membrane protein
MNRVERNSIAVVIIGVIVLIIFVGWLIYTLQTLNDEVVCKQPLDKLNRAEYQFCLERELK